MKKVRRILSLVLTLIMCMAMAREIYSAVRRDVTVSYGKHQDFTDVAVLPGETLVRLFRVVDDPHPLQTKLNFNVRTILDRDHPDNDVTVSLMQYYDSLDYLNE